MKRIVIIVMLLAATAARAFDFKLAAPTGQEVYYTVVAGTSTVKVVSPNWDVYTQPTGLLELPTTVEHDGTTYAVKSIDAEGSDCVRCGFSYPAKAGLGHFIHTYVCNGNPIPTFQGEPERVAIPERIDEFADTLWNNLNEDNKISLWVRYTDLATGDYEEKIINKNK